MNIRMMFNFCVAAIAVTFLPVLAVVFLLALWVPLFASAFVAWAPFTLMVFSVCPLIAVLALIWVRRTLREECAHIDRVGPEQALWSVSAHTWRGVVSDALVVTRDSPVADSSMTFEEGVWEDASLLYSKWVRVAYSLVSSHWMASGGVLVTCGLWLRFSWRLLREAFWWWCAALAVSWAIVISAPAGVVTALVWDALGLIFLLTPPGWPHLRLRIEWTRVWILSFLLDLALVLAALNSDVEKHYSERLAGRRQRVSAVLRKQVMKTVRLISAVRLPEFVRNRFQHGVSAEAMTKGREIMSDLGWPINVESRPPDATTGLAGHEEWVSWKVADTDFATGIRQMRMHCGEALQDLANIAPAYARTEEYRTPENEIRSVSRYFQDRKVTLDVNTLDDVWTIVRPIFANSRLASFSTVMRMWEKKYALGFWMTTPDGKRKLSRRSFIARIGMPAFRALWARTFVRAGEIAPVAHISVKDEALPARKWMADKVRTIVGSPISHYIGSTVFSFFPNHNFQFEATPIKVGMPLNGYWMGRVFDRHSRFSTHIEGDFSEFDSTIEGPVKDIIRAIRKRGYDGHADQKGIADLIDVMYDQVDHQLLGVTSSGSVFRKGSGLTTGHSSTSMDNSLALVIFYMAAWRKITGLSAREFLHFNELSCYGDDHMLSTLAGAPRSWTARNISKVMARWGVVNNTMEKKLRDMTFLGKCNSRITPALRRELNAAGLDGVQRAIWHDKARLVGKLTSKLKSTDVNYRVSRLMSYLTLCAHHPEVYDAITRELKKPALARVVAGQWGSVPTYHDILRAWYKPSSPTQRPVDETPEEQFINDGSLVLVGTPGLLDHVLQALSTLPDVLNPALFNYGPVRAVTQALSSHLQWIPSLITLANGVRGLAGLSHLLQRTPYAWVDVDIVTPKRVTPGWTTLLVRHWLFLLYRQCRPTWRGWSVPFVFRKVADLAFTVRGQVITDLPREFFPFDEILVAALLDYVEFPVDPLVLFAQWEFPDLAAWLDLAWNRVLSFVWTSVPANFSEVDPLLRALANEKGHRLLIKAPTGSGKSTALVAHLSMTQQCPHRKLIVVEPRTLLVRGLAAYVSEAFGIWTTAATSGSDFDPRARVWFMTPQSFLGHLTDVSKHDLVVLDEAHVNEPLYPMLLDLLPKWGFRVVATTATPSVSNTDWSTLSIDIPIAQVFSVKEETRAIADPGAYVNEAVGHVNRLPRHVRAMIIVDTPEQADAVAERLRLPAQVLSSKHDAVVQETQRYVATSVVDVGVTIPGLDVIVTPNWEYGGHGVRHHLTDAVARQRRGRVGRTNNGAIITLSAPTDSFVQRAPLTAVDSWKSALSAGISPALGWHLDPDSMSSLFGLEGITTEQVKDFSRVSHIFLTNFRAMKALELTNSEREAPLGTNSVLVPTGSIGHFSGSVPQDLPEAYRQGLELCGKLLAAIQDDDSPVSLLSHPLSKIRTGPLYRVQNVLMGLGNDPAGWKPELQGAADGVEQVDFDEELAKIYDLLETLKGPDET